MEPVVVNALEDYGADIDATSRRFGYSVEKPWYLGSTLIAGQLAWLPDLDFKDILLPEQRSLWLMCRGDGSFWKAVEEHSKK